MQKLSGKGSAQGATYYWIRWLYLALDPTKSALAIYGTFTCIELIFIDLLHIFGAGNFTHLRQRKNCKNVNKEVRGQISPCYFQSIFHQDTSSKYSRRGSNKTSSELEDNVNDIEDISKGTQNNCRGLQLFVQIKTFLVIIDHRNVTEQRIERNSKHTWQYEYFIPLLKKWPLWVKDFLPRTQAFFCYAA